MSAAVIVELEDGRMGVVNRKERAPGNRLIVRLVDEQHEPLLTEEGKQRIVIKGPDEVKVIGYQD